MDLNKAEETQSNANQFIEEIHRNEKDYEQKSDAEIWKSFKKGDEAAFILIYQRYFDVLVNYCNQFTQNKELIRDCIQDLFIFIRTKRNSISDTDNIKLYLFKCCRNRIIDYLKKDLKIRSITEIDRHLFLPSPSTEEKIINLQTRKNRKKQLQQAMQKLSLKEREIIYYFYYENMDYQSITELLGYEQIKSTRSLLYKALNKLKHFFTLSLPLISWFLA